MEIRHFLHEAFGLFVLQGNYNTRQPHQYQKRCSMKNANYSHGTQNSLFDQTLTISLFSIILTEVNGGHVNL